MRTNVGSNTGTAYDGYTFQQALSGSGLMDYKARNRELCAPERSLRVGFDPFLQRFMQPDTVVAEPGNSQGYNRYAYVNNNPVNATDPSGHFACWDDNRNDPHCVGKVQSVDGIVDRNSSNTIFSIPLSYKAAVTLQVQVTNQPNGTSCGESAFTSCWNYVHPDAPLQVEDVMSTASENNFYTPFQQPFTSPNGLEGLANYYSNSIYGNTSQSSSVQFGNVPIDDEDSTAIAQAFLVDLLNNGNPVIIDASTYIGHPGETENGGDSHFIVIVGYEDYGSNFIYVDSFGYSPDQTYSPGMFPANYSDIWNSWIGNSDHEYGGSGWFLYMK